MQQFARPRQATWRIATLRSELQMHIIVAFELVVRLERKRFSINLSRSRLHVRMLTRQYPGRDLNYNFTIGTRNYSSTYKILMEAMEKYRDKTVE
jgi:hypothetical protein